MNQLPSEKERKTKLKAHCQALDPSVAPSTCSPHGCFLWFSGIKPCRHAPGSSIAQRSSQSLSLQPPRSGYNGAICWSSLMPLAHAHLKRVHMSSDSSHEGSPAGLPTPKASTGCSLQLNKEFCVSSLAPCPESHIVCKRRHWWAWQRIPVSERRPSREQILRFEALLPLPSVEFIRFPTGSQGDEQG